MTAVSARFYVIATSGYGITHGSRPPATSYAVLDRLWAYREVYSAPAVGGVAEAFRRMACERVAEALNDRHEQHMREIGEAWVA